MDTVTTATYAEIIARELVDTPETVHREVLNFLLYLKHGAAINAPELTETKCESPQTGLVNREPFPGLALSEATFGRYWNDPIEDEAWKDL